jgi:hypothetical protein
MFITGPNVTQAGTCATRIEELTPVVIAEVSLERLGGKAAPPERGVIGHRDVGARGLRDLMAELMSEEKSLSAFAAADNRSERDALVLAASQHVLRTGCRPELDDLPDLAPSDTLGIALGTLASLRFLSPDDSPEASWSSRKPDETLPDLVLPLETCNRREAARLAKIMRSLKPLGPLFDEARVRSRSPAMDITTSDRAVRRLVRAEVDKASDEVPCSSGIRRSGRWEPERPRWTETLSFGRSKRAAQQGKHTERHPLDAQALPAGALTAPAQHRCPRGCLRSPLKRWPSGCTDSCCRNTGGTRLTYQ